MNTYETKCKQHIIDSLPDYEGQDVYFSDLGMTLTEGENANGSWYCNTYKAEQDLDSFGRDVVADFIKEYENEFGTKPQHDAYTQPELFHCLMMIIGVEKMLNETKTMQDLWNEKGKLTKKIINSIIEDLE